VSDALDIGCMCFIQTGKSTALKAIEGELPLMEGTRKTGEGLSIG
jgi:hypothetical protein